MPENNQQPSTTEARNEEDYPLHTCACGEQHRVYPGAPSHRETCTSEKKNTDACCCGTGHGPQGNHHRCGQGRSNQ
ncbi:MAG: hypothetical protein WCX63_07090 [Methanoregula sp.]